MGRKVDVRIGTLHGEVQHCHCKSGGKTYGKPGTENVLDQHSTCKDQTCLCQRKTMASPCSRFPAEQNAKVCQITSEKPPDKECIPFSDMKQTVLSGIGNQFCPWIAEHDQTAGCKKERPDFDTEMLRITSDLKIHPKQKVWRCKLREICEHRQPLRQGGCNTACCDLCCQPDAADTDEQ